MKKELRMLAGIILHPVRVIVSRLYWSAKATQLKTDARERQWSKNHERMHHFAVLCGQAYTKSDLYGNLYHGAPEWK